MGWAAGPVPPPQPSPGTRACSFWGDPNLSTGTLGATAAPLGAPAGTGATHQAVPGSQLHAGGPAVAQPAIWRCSQYGQRPWPPPGPLLTLPGLPSPGATLALSPHRLQVGGPQHRVGGSSSPSAARAAASRASASAGKSSFILDSRERSPPATAAARAAASTVCSACPGGREQTGQGQNTEERGRDSLPSSSPRQAGCVSGGTGLPTHAGSSGSRWLCLYCRGWGQSRHRQEPVLRSCHTSITAKLPASISSGGCFPAWSQQDKTLRRADKGAALRGQREKSWAYACPKGHRFGGLALGILAVSMPARLGAELGSAKAQTRDGAGATSEHRDQGTGVSVQEGAQEPSALSLQSANKSLCILFLSFPSFHFQPIFLVTN